MWDRVNLLNSRQCGSVVYSHVWLVLADVMGPDDWHPNVNNNAFTNVMASLAIHWARYFACLCNRNERSEVPDDWIQKAVYLELPFDNVRRLHYQHEGYQDCKYALCNVLSISMWACNPLFGPNIVKYDVTQCKSCPSISPIPLFDINLVRNALRIWQNDRMTQNDKIFY